MNCIAAVKRLLERAGILQPFSDYTVKDAETENLMVERVRSLNELNEHNRQFYERTSVLEQKVKNDIGEFENMVGHLQRSKKSDDARTIIENIIAKRKRRELRRTGRHQPT
jgi:hypothetical protein